MAASDRALVRVFERLALEAGRAIMDVFHGHPAVDLKADRSPVTEADRVAERIILEGLREAFPQIPCVAEEEAADGKAPALSDGCFILVDPLDGTREFVARNADFTVNIALIRDHAPVAGVVLAPCSGRFFSAAQGVAEALTLEDCRILARRRLKVREATMPLAIVASRSHRTPETEAYLRRLQAAELVSVGSSLKFCMIAASEADLYPRFGPTMEWDTAAGDAVLRAAGGLTTTLDGMPLRYGKPGYANPSFVARGSIPETIPLPA